jgi:HAMP domain-containing protein
MGLGLGLILLVASVAGAIISWMAAGALGIINSQHPVFAFWRVPIAILFAGIVITAAFMMRSLRRAAVPVAELMEAAKHVEGGDYTSRVQARVKCANWRRPSMRWSIGCK